MDAPKKPTVDPKEQAVQKILEKNGDINQRFRQFNNQRPLLFLADDDRYHETFVQVLQQKNLIIRTRDIAGATALHRAARNNAVLNLKALIDHCKTNPPFELTSFLNACTIFKKTPLHEAVEQGNHICAGILLLHGAYLNQLTSKGLSEIHLLLQKPMCRLDDTKFEHHVTVLVMLYLYGANFNNLNNNKNAFRAIEYMPAWNDAERQKKQKLQALIKNLKLVTAFENNVKNRSYFQSLVPADICWNIYNFVAERYLSPPNRI